MAAQYMDIQEILQKKLKAYDDLLSTTQLLKEALASNDLVMVVGAIRRRKDLMRLVDGLDRKLGKRWQAYGFDHKGEAVKILPKITSNMEQRLNSILLLDQECTILARSEYEDLGQKLSLYKRGQEGLRGYVPRKPRLPKFLNLKT